MSNSLQAYSGTPLNPQVKIVHPSVRPLSTASLTLIFADDCCGADRHIKAGTDIFRQGQPSEAIYSLVDGWTVLYKLREDGSRQILQFALPGAVLAFMPSRSSVLDYSAQALTDAVVQVVPFDKLARLSSDKPQIGMQLADIISRDRSFAYEHMASIGRSSARERVAALLLELSIRSQLHWPGRCSGETHLPVTQEDIGDATGLTGVHVNRVVRDLCKDRILEFHYRRLCILNRDKLVDLAGIDPHVVMSWINGVPAKGAIAGKANTKVVSALRKFSRFPTHSPHTEITKTNILVVEARKLTSIKDLRR